MEQNIPQIYELEKGLMELQRRENALKEELARAKYDLRQAKAARLEYGGIQAFLDRLRGIREEKEHMLDLNVSKAQSGLTRAERELANTRQALSKIQQDRAGLPALEELPDSPEKFRLEAEFCLEQLPELLEQTLQALEDFREMENEIRTSQIVSPERRQAAATLPVTLAEQCRDWLGRLEKALTGLNITISVPPFFRNPPGYLAGGTEYTLRDRRNEAHNQTLTMKRNMEKLKQNMQQ